MKKSRKYTRNILMIGATAASAWAMPATAQQSTANEDARDEDIIVQGRRAYITNESTSSKTDIPLIRTPQAITVVNRDQMDAQSVRNVAEALRYTAGITAEARGTNSRFDTIFIRGFGGVGANAIYVQNLDGLRLLSGMSYARPQIEQYSLDRIDVLKGPSSILYGQAAPGGLINLTSKRPREQSGGEVLAEIGNYGRYRMSFDVTGPVDDNGNLLARLNATIVDSDTQVNLTKQRRVHVAPSLTLRNDATSLTLLASYQYDPDNGPFGTLPRFGTITVTSTGRIPTSFFDGDPSYDQFKRRQWWAGYQFSHNFSQALSFRSNARYFETDLDVKILNANDYRDPFVNGLPQNSILKRDVTETVETLKAIAIDNQIHANIDMGDVNNSLLLGVDYQRGNATRDLRTSQTIAPPIDYRNPVYNLAIPQPPLLNQLRQIQSQVGVYGQNQLKFAGLNVQFGLRHDWAKQRNINRVNGALSGVPIDTESTTGRLGLLYEFDNGISPYVSYSTSFQPLSGADFSGQAFKPTTGRQYEGGVKIQPRRFPAFLTVAVFDIKQQNLTVPDPAHPGFSIQQGELHSRGAELEAHARIADRLNIVASYAYIDARIVATDKRPLAISKNQFSIWGDLDLTGGFGLGAGVRYTGPYYIDTANTYLAPGYTLFDAGLHYDFGGEDGKSWRVSVNGSNLADKIYVSTCQNAFQCFYGVRRTVIGSLRYRW